MNRFKKVFILLLAVLTIIALLSACNVIFKPDQEPDPDQVTDDPDHVHQFTETGKDSTGHWLYCKDDNEIQEGSKISHIDSDYDGLCNICGYKMGEAHTHTFTEVDYDTTCHWFKCPSDGVKDSATLEDHADRNKDGKCDVCSFGMPLPMEEYIGIESRNYVYTLIVRGAMPEGIGCIKLHYEANGVDYFVSNTAGDVRSYVFSLPIRELPVENAPLIRFDLYTYESASPSDDTAYLEKIDLVRGDFLPGDDIIEHAGNTYTIIRSETNLVIQAEVTPELAVNSIELKDIDGKPYVVVCGIAPKKTPCIKLHASGGAGANDYYGDNVSKERGEFELRMDLSQVPYEDSLLFFHIYIYTSAEPEDISLYYNRLSLMRDTFIAVGDSIEYNGITYTVQPQTQIILKLTEAPKLKITDIVLYDLEIELEDVPTIVIKGVNRSIAKCVKLHVDANGKNDKYLENVAPKKKEGDIEFRISIPDIDMVATWSFHIYAYLDEEPSNNNAYEVKGNINRGKNLTIGQEILTHNGMVYTVIASKDDENALVISVTVATDSGESE